MTQLRVEVLRHSVGDHGVAAKIDEVAVAIGAAARIVVAMELAGCLLPVIGNPHETDAYFREDLSTLDELARVGGQNDAQSIPLLEIPESAPSLGRITPRELAFLIRGFITFARGSADQVTEGAEPHLAVKPLTINGSLRLGLPDVLVARTRWAASDARAIYRCLRDQLFMMPSNDLPWSPSHRGEGGLRDGLERLASKLGPIADLADLFGFGTELGEPALTGATMVYRGDGSHAVNDLVGLVEPMESNLRIAARQLSVGGLSSFEPDPNAAAAPLEALGIFRG